jgi:hypothetical protein
MNSLRKPEPVDKDACIALVHGLQVDLSLLATWLAHTRQPELPHGSIEGLALLRNYLDAYTPCLTRH